MQPPPHRAVLAPSTGQETTMCCWFLHHVQDLRPPSTTHENYDYPPPREICNYHPSRARSKIALHRTRDLWFLSTARDLRSPSTTRDWDRPPLPTPLSLRASSTTNTTIFATVLHREDHHLIHHITTAKLCEPARKRDNPWKSTRILYAGRANPTRFVTPTYHTNHIPYIDCLQNTQTEPSSLPPKLNIKCLNFINTNLFAHHCLPYIRFSLLTIPLTPPPIHGTLFILTTFAP